MSFAYPKSDIFIFLYHAPNNLKRNLINTCRFSRESFEYSNRNRFIFVISK